MKVYKYDFDNNKESFSYILQAADNTSSIFRSIKTLEYYNKIKLEENYNPGNFEQSEIDIAQKVLIGLLCVQASTLCLETAKIPVVTKESSDGS